METQNFQPQPQQNSSVVTVGDWVVTMILMIIPFVNIIMLFIWAFGGSTPASKANWAKATLVFWLIGIVLAIIFWGAFAAMIAGSMGGRY